MFAIIGFISWYGVYLFLSVANHMRYEGSSLENLVGSVLGEKGKRVCMVGIVIM